jgi:methyl-accepting chemotaxis protein
MRDRLSRFIGDERSLSALIPNRARESYLLKFTAVVAGIAVITLVLGLFFQSSIASSLTADQTSRIAGVAEDQATTIEAWANKNEESTRLISTRDAFRDGSAEEISETLTAEFLSLDDEHQAIHYINTETGAIIDSSAPTAAGDTVQDRGYQWLVTGNTDELVFSGPDDVVISQTTVVEGSGRIAFASPIPGTENRALMIPVDVATLTHDFRNPIAGSNTQIVSAAGSIQVDDDTETLGDRYERQSVLDRGLNGDVGAVQSDNLVMGHAPVTAIDQPTSTADVGWVVLVHVPASNAFALQSQISTTTFGIIGIALLGFVVVGATIGRNTVGALDDLNKRAGRLRDGDLETDLTSNRVDEIGRLYGSFAEMRDSLKEQIDSSERRAKEARQEADAARVEAEEKREHLEQTASEYSDTMAQAAAGDLTQRLEPDEESEAMAEIATAFNGMLDELESTIIELQTFADDVAAETESVTEQTDDTTELSADVSQSIQEIADGANSQREQLDTVLSEMSQLSATVEEITSQASSVAGTSRETLEISESGRQSAEDAIEQMQEIETLTEQTVTAVEDLESRFDEVEEIVDLITTIADQTDRLALNASVEAARAGEGGSGDANAGFTVVADEVKTLAEKTKDSAGDIESMIADIREQMEATVDDVQQTRNRVSEGSDTVYEMGEAFESVADNVQRTNEGIQEISEATDDQSRSTQQAVTMIEDVADISQDTSSRTENASAAAQQQADSISDIQNSVQQLATRAADLRRQLAEFTVER